MDKNAIKKYAIWARKELISRISTKALQYGITEEDYGDIAADSVNGQLLTAVERKQRQALIKQIQAKGYQEVIEEVAYTWFNRFSALRFMEVNGYLPSHVRVFTDEENNFKPQILTEAIHLELDGLDMDKVYAYKDANQTEELYKYLLIVQCNALNAILPGMFQKIEDYTELLFPDNLLREGSVVEQMISLVPETDWQDAVQIIGWLYQYYNAEKKDDIFAALKKNIKITKENIPAATQLFTPDWIVRYMVENSLGRLWVEGHPNEDLKANWKYYLEEAEQEPDVQVKLAEIRKEYADLKPEDIKCIDPCMGSGHILAYMFDVLIQIYEAYGYTTREAVASIVENNIYGLDIDDRAAQLANFAVMMKARQYDRRFFSRGIQPKVYAIVESNNIQYEQEFGDFLLSEEHRSTLKYLLKVFKDAKEYGSILEIENRDYQGFLKEWTLCAEATLENLMMIGWYMVANEVVPLLAKQASLLSNKYDVVVTNPPYMGGSGMGEKLAKYVKANYTDSKSDLFAVFIEHCGQMTAKNRYQAMITQHSWMFLSSLEKLRAKLLNRNMVNMAHLGARAFEEIGGEVVQTTSFVMQNSKQKNYKGCYCRLTEPTTQQSKEELFLTGDMRFFAMQDNFAKIPGSPVAYWLSEKSYSLMNNADVFNEKAITRAGMITGNNDIFVRLWFEVSANKSKYNCNNRDEAIISDKKWFPYSKGGDFRKWYGNNDCVVNWFNDGIDMRNHKDDNGKIPAHAFNLEYIFGENICWNSLSSKIFSARYTKKGFLYDAGGSFASVPTQMAKYYLSFLNSNIAFYYLTALNPTMNFQKGNIGSLPIIIGNEKEKNIINDLTDKCLFCSKQDWDFFETSWDFKELPILANKNETSIENAYLAWQDICETNFNQLKANEEELNRIFINIYDLQDELTPEVADKYITIVRIYDTKEEIPASMKGSNYVLTKIDVIKSLLSYAVGCMFGRYSLDETGLVYAGGEWNADKYTTFTADVDNIIPICDDEYFDDDITGRFVQFIETVYGKATLEENLQFIADALGGKGTSREIIRNYFRNDFYKDHCKIYQKRPIYWLFDSGKKGGFKALIYMHRYQPDTIARIRTDYVHEQQSRYRTAIANLEQRMAAAATGERVKLGKQLKKLQNQAEETHSYEEKIHHLADRMISIDLDDGVKHNYAIFQDVLAKIR